MTQEQRIAELSTYIATVVKTIAVAVDKKAEKENWFTLASGYLTTEDLAPTATGEVTKYTYQGGAIRYRYTAFDDSIDAFYMNYENGVFNNLRANKIITL